MKMLLEKLVFLAPIALGGLIPIVSISPVLATGTNIGCLSNLSCGFGSGGNGTVTVGDFVFSAFTNTVSAGGEQDLWNDFSLTVTGSTSSLLSFSNNQIGNPLPQATYTLSYTVTNTVNNISSATLSSFDSNGVNNTGSFIINGSLPISPISVTNTFTIGNQETFGSFSNNYQAVPLETDALPLVGATALFAGAVWWKRRRGAEALDLSKATPDPEQMTDIR